MLLHRRLCRGARALPTLPTAGSPRLAAASPAAARWAWLQPAHARAASSSAAVTPVVDIIAKKREGEELTAAEVHSFVQRFTAGEVADYQMSAWLMAVCLRGMTANETAELTLAMVQSGSVADLSDIPGHKSGTRASSQARGMRPRRSQTARWPFARELIGWFARCTVRRQAQHWRRRRQDLPRGACGLRWRRRLRYSQPLY
jgi:hypothetical protein